MKLFSSDFDKWAARERRRVPRGYGRNFRCPFAREIDSGARRGSAEG